MAYNYSAHQFDGAFLPTRLGNWEVPRKHNIRRPSLNKGPTKVICDENGRFLSNDLRPKTSPWAKYRNTWQLPDRISRYQANELNETFIKRNKTAKKKNCKDSSQEQHPAETAGQQPSETVPADLKQPKQQYPSTRDLEQHGEMEGGNLSELYTEKHNCIDPIAILDEQERVHREKHLHVLGDNIKDNFENMKMQTHIPDKPTERSPSPLIPAYFNFQMAKKMAQENLEHQPLPDCVMDRAFRRLQAQGDSIPGLGLDVIPSASGVGVKTYKAGPTHCTKMKVYRPKTCGVVPKPVSESQMYRPLTCFPGKQKVNSMDLAIGWDYRPDNPLDEPRPPKHIDGSNGSAAPAVFTLVKTPRSPERVETGRSAGIFNNTLGNEGFFEKDILRRKTSFSAQRSKSGMKCSCGTSPINFSCKTVGRSLSASRLEAFNGITKRYKSSPNLSQIANPSQGSHGKENHQPVYNMHISRKKEHTCSKYGPKNRNMPTMKRNVRLCQRVEPQHYPEITPKDTFKTPFKAGIPKSNSSGTVTSFDSGCSTMSSGTCSTKPVHVPKPRHPYTRKNYNIDTLVPPFTCIKGGAGQGGYPEYWRLASVYQHAYKPLEQRKRPLLETVYK